MTPRPLPPDQIKTPVSIGIYEGKGSAAASNQEGQRMTIERAIVIAILALLLLFIAERVL